MVQDPQAEEVTTNQVVALTGRVVVSIMAHVTVINTFLYNIYTMEPVNAGSFLLVEFSKSDNIYFSF